MPAEPIHVVYRSDASGTTDNFQQYLDAASNGAWGKGTGKMFNGGVGQGAKGNEGTSAAVKNTEGAITYNEWSFAQQQRLLAAKIKTTGGPDPVAISDSAVAKTIAGAKIAGQGNDLVLDTLVVLHTHPARRLPDRAGQLRDRLFQIPRPRGRQGGQGVYAVHHRSGSGWPGRQRIHTPARRIPVQGVHRR